MSTPIRPTNAAEAYAWANLAREEAPTPMGWASSSCGRIELALTLDDASSGYHMGACDADIAELRRVPYIAEQLEQIRDDVLREHLSEYGAWSDEELANREDSLDRCLWLACGDIVDTAHEVEA